jgi:hypothetical protein
VRIICTTTGCGTVTNHYIVQIEIGVSRLRLGPRRKCANDIVAEQHHQVIAFGKDHQARWRSDPTDNVRHGICVSGE